MNKYHLDYFASLREKRGLGSETLESAATTPEKLYGELRARYDFHLDTKSLRPAVNEEFVGWNHELHDGVTVVFLQPLAGG